MKKQPLCLAPGRKFRLRDFDAGYCGGIKNKKNARKELDENIAVPADLGYRLYAEDRRSLLLVLQGMDTAGRRGIGGAGGGITAPALQSRKVDV
ncbi:MAG: hypothetical protein KKE86_13175 [Planctomycetes bacterium]|nr:hypothetical protein [Planctomycetota bacterium]MBU4400275.1 hypothetical protein [Planctomycetota bacterium]MCG2683375.1 hypothetical protein [Planctomycetales bacterium]